MCSMLGPQLHLSRWGNMESPAWLVAVPLQRAFMPQLHFKPLLFERGSQAAGVAAHCLGRDGTFSDFRCFISHVLS